MAYGRFVTGSNAPPVDSYGATGKQAASGEGQLSLASYFTREPDGRQR